MTENVKRRIPKRVLQENNARQIFRKANIYYPLMGVSRGNKCSFFGKFGVLRYSPFYLIAYDKFVTVPIVNPFNKVLSGLVDRLCFDWYGQTNEYWHDLGRSSENLCYFRPWSSPSKKYEIFLFRDICN